MNSIFRPVMVLLVLGLVLGLFALAGRKDSKLPEPRAKAPPLPVGVAAARDAKSALENLITLLNKGDAAGLRERLTTPFYLEGRKIEDDQSFNEFIQKAVEQPHAFAVERAVQTTAREAGLPPEADDVLTSNDTILVADLRDRGESVRRVFVFRRTGVSLKLLAMLKAQEP